MNTVAVKEFPRSFDNVVERTFDDYIVREIIGNKELHKRAGSYIPVEAYKPSEQKDIYYLIAYSENEAIGVIIFHVFNSPICYQGHVNYLPDKWGTGLESYTKKAIDWMFTNTECKKIVALSPDSYPEVLKHSIKSGLMVEGYLKKSTMVNGKIENQTILGIEK